MRTGRKKGRMEGKEGRKRRGDNMTEERKEAGREGGRKEREGWKEGERERGREEKQCMNTKKGNIYKSE